MTHVAIGDRPKRGSALLAGGDVWPCGDEHDFGRCGYEQCGGHRYFCTAGEDHQTGGIPHVACTQVWGVVGIWDDFGRQVAANIREDRVITNRGATLPALTVPADWERQHVDEALAIVNGELWARRHRKDQQP